MSIADFVQKITQSKQHSYLYHFSDECNFPQIKKHGLLSKNRMRQLGFWPKSPSGNQWSWDADDRKNISSYVSLCMTRNHPMSYVAVEEKRIENPRYLCVSPDVLLREGVLFAIDIANRADVTLTELRTSIPLIDTEVLYDRTDWKDVNIQSRLKSAERYEILVPNMIELNLIPRVY